MVIEFTEDINRKLENLDFAKEFGSEVAKTAFAVTLARTRKRKSITQDELARRLGVKQSYIAKLERGDANPTIGMGGKILAVLGMRLQADVAPLTLKPEITSELRAISFRRNLVARCIRHSNINIPGARSSAGSWYQVISTIQVG